MSITIAPLWRHFVPGHRAALTLLIGTALGAACQRWRPQSEPAALRSAPHVADTVASASPARSEPEALCLAALPAGAALAQRLTRARALTLSHREQAEGWTELGRAWLAQAQSSGDSGYTLNADACARQALSLAPEHSGALGLRARVKLDAHEFEQAHALARAVLDRDPDDVAALGTLSDAALELGSVQEASQAAQQLMDLDPGLPAYARASYLRWLHGQEQPAIELARLAIDAAGDPEERDARAWTLLQAAQLFWHRADLEGAEAGYRMAIAVRPGYAPALLGLGRVSISRGQLQAAAQSFSLALAGHPSVEAAALLGDVLLRLGDAAGAARSYARAEQLGRFDARSLSYFYSVRDREPAAALALAEQERRTRGDLYTEDALAWALYRNGQLEAAERHSALALAFGTRDALLLFHRGAIQLALGQRASGQALLRRALQQNPHFDLAGAAEARRLLGAAA